MEHPTLSSWLLKHNCQDSAVQLSAITSTTYEFMKINKNGVQKNIPRWKVSTPCRDVVTSHQREGIVHEEYQRKLVLPASAERATSSHGSSRGKGQTNPSFTRTMRSLPSTHQQHRHFQHSSTNSLPPDLPPEEIASCTINHEEQSRRNLTVLLLYQFGFKLVSYGRYINGTLTFGSKRNMKGQQNSKHLPGCENKRTIANCHTQKLPQ